MNYKKINQYMSNKQIDKLYPQLNYMKFFFVPYFFAMQSDKVDNLLWQAVNR